MSENETDMQRMLDAVGSWCNKWRLTVNEAKSNVVHFRPPSLQVSNVVFTCAGKTIATHKSYKYLGLWLNEHLDMKFTVKQTTKAASRALGAVYTKFISGGGMTHDVYTKLVETVVEPVLFYGSGIWGLEQLSRS